MWESEYYTEQLQRFSKARCVVFVIGALQKQCEQLSFREHISYVFVETDAEMQQPKQLSLGKHISHFYNETDVQLQQPDLLMPYTEPM